MSRKMKESIILTLIIVGFVGGLLISIYYESQQPSILNAHKICKNYGHYRPYKVSIGKDKIICCSTFLRNNEIIDECVNISIQKLAEK